MGTPQVSVCLATHERPRRLEILLEALERQTLPRERFEVVVCHNRDEPATEEVLARHASEGWLRTVVEEEDPRNPGLKRNRAVAAARGPLIAFTDDDCRPDERWLEALLATAAGRPGAIVQGRTVPDPRDHEALAHPHMRTVEVDPPNVWGQTCNILYPRAVLDAVSGFDTEAFAQCAGEDTDLLCRALEQGAPLVAAEGAVVHHAVEPATLAARLRWTWTWRTAVRNLRRHPDVRRGLHLGLFWRETHLPFLVAVAGLAAALVTRRVSWLGFVVPWLERRGVWYHRFEPRPLAASVRDTAGHAVVDAMEVGTMAVASARHRTLVL